MTNLSKEIIQINKGNISELQLKYLPDAITIVNQWDLIKPVSMTFYKSFHPVAWAIACNMVGMYQIITEELVDFVHHLTQGKKTIEICAGYGVLGRALGAPMIDRKLHLDKRVKDFFAAQTNQLNQLPKYPNDIIEATANKAYEEYKPDWVIGAWVTQKLMPGSKIGMMYGPVEEKFIEKSSYLNLGSGHLPIHQNKRIMKLPHYLIEADWIIDKTGHKSKSQMRIWTKTVLDFDKFPEHLEFDYISNDL